MKDISIDESKKLSILLENVREGINKIEGDN